jgi:hypothetical protein
MSKTINTDSHDEEFMVIPGDFEVTARKLHFEQVHVNLHMKVRMPSVELK